MKRLLPLVYSALTSFPYIEKDFDALTQYELLQAIVKKINEIIPYVNDIAEGMEQTVTDLLNTWKEDGTLEDIIKDAYFSKVKSVNLSVKAQFFGQRMIDNVGNDNLVYSVQGAHTNGSYWWYALLSSDDQTVLIMKMSMDGTIITANKITGGILGHANGMSGGLDDDTIVTIDNDKITVINANSLQIISVNTISSDSNYCIDTDYENNRYIVYNGNNIRTYDKNFNIIDTIPYVVPTNANAGNIKQGCAYNKVDNRLYLIYSDPSTVYAVNMEDATDVIITTIDYEYWHGGEMEDGTFIDGDFYFTTSYINNCGNRHIRFWYTNFYTGVKPVVAYASYITSVNMGDLKVNSDTNDFRPNGTATHPFCRIGDAIEFGERYIIEKPDSDFVINCSGSANLGRVSIHNLKNSVLINMNRVPSDVIFGVNCAGALSIRNINIVSNANNNQYLLYCLRCAKFVIDKGTIDDSVSYTSGHMVNIAESNAYVYDICTPEEYAENNNDYISDSLVLAPVNVFRSILQTNNTLREHCDITNGVVIVNGGIGLHDGYIDVTAWE